MFTWFQESCGRGLKFLNGFRKVSGNVLEGFRRFKEGFKKVLGSFLQVFRVWNGSGRLA